MVAYADPIAAGGEVAEIAGQEARARLANELNQAILGESFLPVDVYQYSTFTNECLLGA